MRPFAKCNRREALKRSKSGEFIHDVAQLSDWIVRSRTGELLSATQDVVGYLKNRPKTDADAAWRLLALRFFAGEVPESEFLKQAEAAKSGTKEGEQRYSFFFAGMKRLAHDDKAGAAILFEKCLKLAGKKPAGSIGILFTN